MRIPYVVIAVTAFLAHLSPLHAELSEAPPTSEPAEYTIGQESERIGSAYFCRPEAADQVWNALFRSVTEFKLEYDQEVTRMMSDETVVCATWGGVSVTPVRIEGCVVDEIGNRWTRVTTIFSKQFPIPNVEGEMVLFTLSDVVDPGASTPYECEPMGRTT